MNNPLMSDVLAKLNDIAENNDSPGVEAAIEQTRRVNGMSLKEEFEKLDEGFAFDSPGHMVRYMMSKINDILNEYDKLGMSEEDIIQELSNMVDTINTTSVKPQGNRY